MELHLHYTQRGKRGNLVVEGSLVVYTLNKWKELISHNVTEIETLVANCSKLEQIDTAGVQVLISTKKLFSKNQKKFIIVNHSLKLVEYLDIYGLIGMFEDKVQISLKEKANFDFKYGLKRLPRYIKL